MKNPRVYYTNSRPVLIGDYDTGTSQGWTDHVNTGWESWEEFRARPRTQQIETAMNLCSTWGDADRDTPPVGLEKEGINLFEERRRIEDMPWFNGHNFPGPFADRTIDWFKRVLLDAQK